MVLEGLWASRLPTNKVYRKENFYKYFMKK